MSLLNPGGRRNADGVARVFGYDAIKQLLKKRGRTYPDRGSIAQGNRWGGPHLHKREIQRRLAHQARRSEVKGEYLSC